MPKKGVKKAVRKKQGLDIGKRREILAIISVGASRESASKYVRCSPATIRNEMLLDPGFAEDIRSAEEQSEVFFLQKIRAAANKEQYWRAAAWALERRCPNRYAPRGACSLSEEQVIRLVSDFVEVVVPEIHDSTERRNILRKVNRLVHAMKLPEEMIDSGVTEERE